MAIQAVERLTPETVLAELHACDHAEKSAAARRLQLAVVWAELHPAIADQPYDKVVDSLTDEVTGATVAAIAEFAAVHGVSTNSGRQLIGDAVTLQRRLPRCWNQMVALNLPAWKARLLAQAAHGLGDRAVGWLDTQAALLGAKLGVRTIKRLVLLAQAREAPPIPPTSAWCGSLPTPMIKVATVGLTAASTLLTHSTSRPRCGRSPPTSPTTVARPIWICEGPMH